MAFIPMKSRTELIVEENAAFMEFDLTTDMGYGQWMGMFQEYGQFARLFNGYMVQNSVFDAQMSTSAVELHLFSRGMFVAPPKEQEQFYFEIQRDLSRVGRVYFRLPAAMKDADIEGYKPPLEELIAVDIWTETFDHFSQIIYSFFYEADILTETREYNIRRFSKEQLDKVIPSRSTRS